MSAEAHWRLGGWFLSLPTLARPRSGAASAGRRAVNEAQRVARDHRGAAREADLLAFIKS
jgi:hypothetical protein